MTPIAAGQAVRTPLYKSLFVQVVAGLVLGIVLGVFAPDFAIGLKFFSDAFLKLIEAKKTRKGDLAQAIASRIAAGDPFVVPLYLADAIRAAAQA